MTELSSTISTPLLQFEEIRSQLLKDVADRTFEELNADPKLNNLELLLGETLYQENQRLKRNRPNFFTKERFRGDRALWNQIQSGLLKASAVSDRKALLQQVLGHYLEEIGGHFSPGVYRFTTEAVPWGMSWIFNSAGRRTLIRSEMLAAMNARLNVFGETEQLRKLAQKGTVLMVPTHQSNIDSVLVGYAIYRMGLPPFSYGAGLNLFSNPVLSFFMSRLGAYTVDRQKGSSIYKMALKNYSTRILREGIHSIFFPGGGRCRSGAVESKLKLGLLGTALEAQAMNLRDGRPKPNVYIVPMVTSYHFVLEASTLIEDYLADAGKHRFIIMDDESWQAKRVVNFFRKMLIEENKGVTVRIGRALDVFGNFVDDEGRSIGPNGTTIDPVKWLTTRGQVGIDPDRDREYTRELGQTLVDRFHRENTVLSSHLVAFSFFEALRKTYPDLDLYRFLRLSHHQRTLALDNFMPEAEDFHKRVKKLADDGRLYLCDELKTSDTLAWVKDGVANLGQFHEHAVVKIQDGTIFTEDMNLLYYYRNRLTGYRLQKTGGASGHGFLA